MSCFILEVTKSHSSNLESTTDFQRPRLLKIWQTTFLICKRTVLAPGQWLYFPACQSTAYFMFSRSCLSVIFLSKCLLYVACFLYQDNYQNKVLFCFSPPEATSRTRGEQVTFIQLVLLHCFMTSCLITSCLFSCRFSFRHSTSVSSLGERLVVWMTNIGKVIFVTFHVFEILSLDCSFLTRPCILRAH